MNEDSGFGDPRNFPCEHILSHEGMGNYVCACGISTPGWPCPYGAALAKVEGLEAENAELKKRRYWTQYVEPKEGDAVDW